eukprot:Gregarina_sp_Pseudo_9__277@NODE_1178_length_1811_cov_119_061512_g1104_i0_p1_GENE_NODE_1178_length_1811_cov_119_061512_g1104_i0NODE_1178_length_1811_cov_119_061512_g1104_i0_p1_ORF_typecomplete_len384_score101_75Ank_2/PF12796_7/8_7e05Ank_2/PF12796_7/4_6e16Ank_2/PF12796_7/2_2e23Ank_2/PF12796_7/1_6e10Ank_4/PF13637_6/0_0036Ank_4/PF13637_6/2_7e15Ank_4/PF13637_6/9_6e17Ank_4/PF13637_6/0_0029Ank_5/PF13857_6/0_0022Ank_5/PF13857_6/4e06Ank_5/PF13857_6/1_1e10Ank_5/PF13857_6/5_1e13Ank/PF00023_30/0_051Ank/PF00
MHIPSSMLVALPRLRANLVHLFLFVYSYLLHSRAARFFVKAARSCVSPQAKLTKEVPRSPSPVAVKPQSPGALPSLAVSCPKSAYYRRPPTISTSSCLPSAQMPAESSLSAAGSARATMVSRQDPTNLGTSTKSVDILSKPPVASTHRRSSSVYGSDDVEQARMFSCLVKAIRRHEHNSVRNLLSSVSTETRLSVLKRCDPQQGLTPLHFAVQERQYDVVNELLLSVENSDEARRELASSAGATLNSYAPIHIAAIRGDCDIISLLLANGASPNATSKLSATPLHLAASKGHTAACKLLLENGSNVNAATKTGNTALMSAVHNKNLEMVNLLVGFGANPKITTQSGLNALGLALSLNATEILLVLEGSVKKHGHRRTPSSSLQ